MRVRKAKALCAMNEARGRGEEFYDPARKEDIFRQNKNPSGIVRRTSQRPVGGLGESVECLESHY